MNLEQYFFISKKWNSQLILNKVTTRNKNLPKAAKRNILEDTTESVIIYGSEPITNRVQVNCITRLYEDVSG